MAAITFLLLIVLVLWMVNRISILPPKTRLGPKPKTEFELKLEELEKRKTNALCRTIAVWDDKGGPNYQNDEHFDMARRSIYQSHEEAKQSLLETLCKN